MSQKNSSEEQNSNQPPIQIFYSSDPSEIYYIIKYAFSHRESILIDNTINYLIQTMNLHKKGSLEKLNLSFAKKGQEDRKDGDGSIGSQLEDLFPLSSESQKRDKEQLSEVYEIRYKVFEHFEKRGRTKNMQFSFDPLTKTLSIFMLKSWVQGQLRLIMKGLRNVLLDFQETWIKSFHPFLMSCLHYFVKSADNKHFKIVLQSIDIISITFDIIYHKNSDLVYRYIYSPFQWTDKYEFSSFFTKANSKQQLKCLVLDKKTSLLPLGERFYEDFYGAQDMPFLNNLRMDKIYQRLINRTDFFYKIHCVVSGKYAKDIRQKSHLEFKQKCLNTISVDFRDFKKFIFAWKTPQKSKKDQKIILKIAFVIEEPQKKTNKPIDPFDLINLNDPIDPVDKFTVKITILDPIQKKMVNYNMKKMVGLKLAELISTYNYSRIGQNHSYLQPVILSQKYPHEMDDFELKIVFHISDRIELFFTGLITIVTDTLNHQLASPSNANQFKIETKEWFYIIQHQNVAPHVTCSLVVQYKGPQYVDFEAMRKADPDKGCIHRFGLWKFVKANRINRVKRLKNGTFEERPQTHDQNWDKFYFSYFNLLLRNFTYHMVHRDILKFSEVLTRQCYRVNRYNVYIRTEVDLCLKTVLQVWLKKLCPEAANLSKKTIISRIPVFKLLTHFIPGHNSEDKPLIEVTYRMMHFFSNDWHMIENEGTHIIRILKSKLEYVFEGICVATHSYEMPNNTELKEKQVISLLEQFDKREQFHIDHMPL